MGLFNLLRMIGLLYVVSFGGMYYFSSRYGKPPVLPGDVYRVNTAGKRLYLPFGSAFIITMLMVILISFIAPKFGG